MAKWIIRRAVLFLPFISISFLRGADEFSQTLKPFFASHCVKCHGGDKVKGKVNLKEIDNMSDFLAKPELIQDLLGVI